MPALRTPYLMFNPTRSAVICSTVREFSKGPASTPLAPEIEDTSSRTVFFPSRSSPQTRTSQSILCERSLKGSALTLLKAVTTMTPFGTALKATSAAEPTQRPSVLVGLPPTAVSSGTVTLTRILPGVSEGLTVFSVLASVANGTVTTTIAAALQAWAVNSQETLLLGPTAF